MESMEDFFWGSSRVRPADGFVTMKSMKFMKVFFGVIVQRKDGWRKASPAPHAWPKKIPQRIGLHELHALHGSKIQRIGQRI